MKIDRSTRRPFHHFIFTGVLAGSLFAASGALAVEPLKQDDFYSVISANPSGQYVLTEDIDIAIAVGESGTYDSTVFGTFHGTLDGANKSITGLTKPLFATVLAAPNETVDDAVVNTIEIKNLKLETVSTGFIGRGALANISDVGTNLENISVTGRVESSSNYIGGIVGELYGSISNSSSQGQVSSTGNYVGGLVGLAVGNISNSYSKSNVTSTGGYVGGIAGELMGNINSSYSNGTVVASGDYVGGLVGKTEGIIQNSYSLSDIEINSTSAIQYVGGLAGYATNFSIQSSYSAGDISTTSSKSTLAFGGAIESIGNSNIAGFVGRAHTGTIKDSYSLGNVTAISNTSSTGLYDSFSINNSSIGGFLGSSYDVNIDHSTSEGSIRSVAELVINGDLTGNASSTSTFIGGFIGYLGCSTRCLSEEILVSQVIAKGNIESIVSANVNRVNGALSVYNEDIGKLVGNSNNTKIEQSTGIGNVTPIKSQSTFGTPGSLFFYNQNIGSEIGNEGLGTIFTPIDELITSPSVITTLTRESTIGQGKWNVRSSCNSGLPYLIELEVKYLPRCQQATSGNSGEKLRNLNLRLELREVKKIEKSVGFKNEAPLPKSAPIAFVESTEKIDLAKVKAVEIEPTANAKVVAKAGEALQISFKSESKEPVELWVKSPDGTWLLAGVITFDKDGKAVLPPLQFKSAGDYSLVLSKPSAGSAKGSAPLNQTGSLLVAVS
jgi:hypothetical protein